jgi:hypothetical protein
MYKAPTEEEIAHVERAYPLMVHGDNGLTNEKTHSFCLVRKNQVRNPFVFFTFEARHYNNTVSIFKLQNGPDAITGDDTWDDITRVLAVRAIIKWAKMNMMSEVFINVKNVYLFEALWDEGFERFAIYNKEGRPFSAFGQKQLD